MFDRPPSTLLLPPSPSLASLGLSASKSLELESDLSDGFDGGHEAAAEWREAVFDGGRRARDDFAIDDAIALELAQSSSERFRRDATEFGLELGDAAWLLLEVPHHVRRPRPAHDLEACGQRTFRRRDTAFSTRHHSALRLPLGYHILQYPPVT